MVITMIATNDPGIFFDTFGVSVIKSMLTKPTAVVIQSTVLKC